MPGAVEPAIEALPAAKIDDLEPLWSQLLGHHGRVTSHLAALGPTDGAGYPWSLRRERYLEWLQSPLAKALVARDADRLLGYAMVHVVDAGDVRSWGDQIGVLETLVIREGARGTGVGELLLRAARSHLASNDIQIMRIAVMAGNEGALRFYRREGAVDYMHTLAMPITDGEPQ